MTTFFQILGGLGVFLFGLRIMSSGLQQVAGERMRAVLAKVTSNRFAGIAAGCAITCVIQSSSATTVMIVSFANAGLLTLTQAIGPIMGANIGTTFTGWLVSLLGFKVDISAFALPVIGLGFPLSFVDSAKARQWSNVLVGFGFLFLGLEFLKNGVPDIGAHPEALEFLKNWSGYGVGSTLLFVLVASVLTVVIQSSSAMMAITITMAAAGWIDFPIAAAMVLGENIGTTVTAWLASLGANRVAKRVARVHMLFNVIGVLWMLPLLSLILQGIDAVIPGDPMSDPLACPTHLAAFHTFFNLANTALLMWFVPQLARVATWMIPTSEDETAEVTRLKPLQMGLLTAPELALFEVRRALQQMVEVVEQMFGQLAEVLTHPNAKLGNVVESIKRGETRTDEMEEEIVAFCAHLAGTGSSPALGEEVTVALDMAKYLERCGDYCMNLVLLAQRRYDKGYKFNEMADKDLAEMIGLVGKSLSVTHHSLVPEGQPKKGEAQLIEREINKLRDRARKRHAESMQQGTLGVREGLVFIDMLNNMERLGDCTLRVVEVSSDSPAARAERAA